jgi:alkanesulfonate monooxygenase SsuD/methylene tetrahydromethanopterin reductase-like flavin-dependent oxidoreductase (luciferase family)
MSVPRSHAELLICTSPALSGARCRSCDDRGVTSDQPVARPADGVRFGVLVLPNEPWPDLVARWRRLDRSGVDSVWSCDHFAHATRPDSPWFEGWTGLAALAAATEHVTVGLLVGAIVSRPPTMLAKQAVTVDHITGGRLEIALGAGGAPDDQAMWGVDEWSPLERSERFAEYVELVDHLSRERVVTFAGRWYSTTGAVMDPGFVHGRRPRLTLAAHGRRTVEVVARYADTWNTYGPTLEQARRTRDLLRECCGRIGRDPGEIRMSVLLGIMAGTAWTSPAEFEDVVARWHAEGFRDFIFYDPPYGRPGVPVAPPSAIDAVLGSSLPLLRSSLG